MDADQDSSPLRLFSKNSRNIVSLDMADHGGTPGEGYGADWVRAVLLQEGLTQFLDHKIMLLAQPRIYGRGFNPVSFWFVMDKQERPIIIIAEVNNTFGERHSYICQKSDLSPISREDHLQAKKVFYVSPFQSVEGEYGFRFDISDTKVGIWIDYRDGDNGVYATLTGKRTPLSDATIVKILLKRPFGFIRVTSLIYWQAIRLKLKGALFRARGLPPTIGVSR